MSEEELKKYIIDMVLSIRSINKLRRIYSYVLHYFIKSVVRQL